MRFICKNAVLDLLTGLRYNEHNHGKVYASKRLTVLVENFAVNVTIGENLDF